MRKNIIIAIFLYIAQFIYSFGTLTADVHYKATNEWPSLHLTQRDDIGFVTFVSLVPVGFIATSTMTNFNQHGWELTWSKK